MKVFCRIVLILVVVLRLCLQVWGEEKIDSGETILQKAVQVYKAIQTYQDETTMIMYMPGMEEGLQVQFSVAIQRPNKIAVVVKSGSWQELGITGDAVVSDGKKVWMYASIPKQYRVKEAPETIEKLLAEYFPDLSLFGNATTEELMKCAEKIELIGEEILEGVKTFHLCLHTNQGKIDYWVDTKNYLVRRIKTGGPTESEEMGMEIIHNQIKVDEKIPADTFIFKTPKEATEIKEFGEEKTSAAGKEREVPPTEKKQKEKELTATETKKEIDTLIQRLKSKGISADAEYKRLVQIGKPAVDPLIATLKDKDKNVRHSAAEALGNIKDIHAIDSLIAVLRDKDGGLRIGAAQALSRITGQAFGEDTTKWEAWWMENKVTLTISSSP